MPAGRESFDLKYTTRQETAFEVHTSSTCPCNMRITITSTLGLLASVASASLQVVPGSTWTAVSTANSVLRAQLTCRLDQYRSAYPSPWRRHTQGRRYVVLVCTPTFVFKHAPAYHTLKGRRRQDQRHVIYQRKLLLLQESCRMELRGCVTFADRIGRYWAKPRHRTP